MLIRFFLLLLLISPTVTGFKVCLTGKALTNRVYGGEVSYTQFGKGTCECLLSVDCLEPQDEKCELIKNVEFSCHKGNLSSPGPSSLRLVYNKWEKACLSNDHCYDDIFGYLFYAYKKHLLKNGQEQRRERVKHQWRAMVYAVINKDGGGKESVKFVSDGIWLLWTLGSILTIGCGGGLFYLEFLEGWLKRRKERLMNEEKSCESPSSEFFASEGNAADAAKKEV